MSEVRESALRQVMNVIDREITEAEQQARSGDRTAKERVKILTKFQRSLTNEAHKLRGTFAD